MSTYPGRAASWCAAVCELLAARYPVLIMMTARGDLEDRILGLEMGADDYMVKPFEPRELLARIGARLRRQAYYVRPGGSGRNTPPLRFGPFEFDSARQALSRSGEQLVLTRAELAIFEIFARHPRQVLARERICELTRRSVATSTRSIDVQIARLRRLLRKTPTILATSGLYGVLDMPSIPKYRLSLPRYPMPPCCMAEPLGRPRLG